MFQYAITLIRGIGAAKNVTDGDIWMLKAAELGHRGAQSEFGLARLADYNLQVTTDPGPAIKWLSRAAEQRDANAMFWLGTFYLMSKAYHAPERGAQLLKKCSEETLDDRCTFAYAASLETGQGVPIDLVRAAAFYRLANEAKPEQGKLERLAGVEKQLSDSGSKKRARNGPPNPRAVLRDKPADDIDRIFFSPVDILEHDCCPRAARSRQQSAVDRADRIDRARR